MSIIHGLRQPMILGVVQHSEAPFLKRYHHLRRHVFDGHMYIDHVSSSQAGNCRRANVVDPDGQIAKGILGLLWSAANASGD